MKTPLTAALLVAVTLLAATPSDVLDFIAAQADALSNDDAQRFLDRIDPATPDYAVLKGNVESMLAANDVESEIEVVADDGDANRRTLTLDWVLITREKGAFNGTNVTRRQVVKCKMERRGKQWKIIALEPVAFFKF